MKHGQDLLWKEFFRDPSQWWDRRHLKLSPAHPDFKHKGTNQSLWIDGWHNRSWVAHELRRRGLAPAQVQCEDGDAVRKDADGVFVSLLRACTKNKDLCRGTRVHEDIIRRGLLENCLDALVTMYAKCGALAKARDLFDAYRGRDRFRWTALIAGYAEKGQGQDAFNCFEQMQLEGLCPDAVTLVCILKACGLMKAGSKGKRIHDEIAKQGLLQDDTVLGSSLICMYTKCDALVEAKHVLEDLPIRDVVSWNSLITGYAEHGKGVEVLLCSRRMQQEGISPDEVTFSSILKACGSVGAVEKGERIHDEIAKQGLLANDGVLGAALVHMYAKCDALGKARCVVEEHYVRNTIAWNALFTGYVEHGNCEQALNCFTQMQREGASADAVTYAAVFKACGSIKALEMGSKIHGQIAKRGLLQSNFVLGTAVLDMYAQCGALTKALKEFDKLSVRNVVSWNALMAGYVRYGEGEKALDCYQYAQLEGFSPDEVTFSCILKACGGLRAVDKGDRIHDDISKQGLMGPMTVLGSALVDMYAKCGAFHKARQVLEELPIRDVVCWTALVGGYADHGKGEEALDCYEQMQHEGFSPNASTFVCLLRAFGDMGAADQGAKIHDRIKEQGLLGNNVVLGTALVDMYAKCGTLVKARQVLEELPVRDAASWTILMAGYVEHGQGEQALNCFKQMQHEGLSPDAAMFSCVLSACGHLGLVEEAQVNFVNMSNKFGIKPDLEHYTCMVDLFGRSGHLDKAIGVIEEMPLPSGVVWATLLGACYKWGQREIGQWVFEHAVQLDKSGTASYVVRADIDAAPGMHKDAGNIKAMSSPHKIMEEAESGEWVVQ